MNDYPMKHQGSILLGPDPEGVPVVIHPNEEEPIVDFLLRAQSEAETLATRHEKHRWRLIRKLEQEGARIGAEVKPTGIDPHMIDERREDANDCRAMAEHLRQKDVLGARLTLSRMLTPELVLPSEVIRWIEARGGPIHE